MDIDQDNVEQCSIVPDHVLPSASTSIALPHAALACLPMQVVDTPFDGHHTTGSDKSGESAVLSHFMLIISLMRQHRLRL